MPNVAFFLLFFECLPVILRKVILIEHSSNLVLKPVSSISSAQPKTDKLEFHLDIRFLQMHHLVSIKLVPGLTFGL